MGKRRFRTGIFSAAAMTLLILLLLAAVLQSDMDSRPAGGNGLFCWEKEVLTDETESDTLWRVMEQYNLRELYQYIPSDLPSEVLSSFFAEAEEHRIKVYLLTGDPTWARDETGEALVNAVRQAASVRRRMGGSALKGVMMDVEPYLLPEWEEEAESLMDSYVSAMKEARKQAEEDDLFLYACIPYYYDSEGLTSYLNALMEQGCHGIAVMNYYRENETKHLRYEWQQAKRLNKPIVNVYELQAPGIHDLSEINTYHETGMEGIEKSFRNIQKSLSYDNLAFAVHDYKALLEVEDIE